MPYQTSAPQTGSIPAGERPSARSDGGFGVADFIRVVSERIWLIAAVTAATVVLAFVVLMLLPTTYSSTALVMLDTRKNNVSDLSSVLSDLPTDSASLQNQIQILTSRDLAAKVIARLQLYNDPEFYSGPKDGLLSNFRAALDPKALPANGDRAEAALDSVIDKFSKHLSVATQGLSTTISVTFTSNSAEKAARIANAIVDAYIEDQLTTKFEANRKTTDWLTDRVNQLAKQVQAADAAAQQYRAEHNLDQTTDGSSIVDQ
ncbi:MAG TPA: Wzz/FepE/Etk N-terminal domain-containing protein, partial [Rhizomicrobium sp.]|nr:Wzz/FepE/Etk N-terminal domain-containing protein [Rhizomicrobium sp.]